MSQREGLQDLLSLRKLVYVHFLYRQALLEDVLRYTQVVVDFQGARLRTRTTFSFMKLVIFLDDTNGYPIFCENQSKDEAARA